MGYDLNGNIVNNSTDNSNNDVAFENVNSVLGIFDRKEYSGRIMANGNWGYVNNAKHKYKFTVIKVNGGETITGNDSIRIIAVTDFNADSVIEGNNANLISAGIVTAPEYTLPDDAKYLICETMMDNVKTEYSNGYYINGINYAKTAREELKDYFQDNGVNWVAFGDSITERYYSLFNDDGTVTTRENGWGMVYPYLLAKKNYWNFTNKGTGGMGWIMTSTSSSAYIAYNRIKEIDFTQYNLVTFAYGINDWKGDRPMGNIDDEFVYSDDMVPTTVIQSMRYCFEYILRRNPNIKIIVITPLNCRGYSFNFGDNSTCWARGYTGFSNTGTLDQFADKMKEVCDLYGIEYIDMTRFSCINKTNIATLLPDGVHPSLECHELLARELASKINFK